MAAANLHSRGLPNLGKRFITQICYRNSAIVLPSLSFRMRSVHGSVYDKNPEEQVHSTVVPDHVNPTQPEQYWAPDPKTGVFGPTTDDHPAPGGDVHASASEKSVLEQKTFFRPLEDLDKPVQR